MYSDNMLICNTQLKIIIRYVATVNYNHSNNSNVSLYSLCKFILQYFLYNYIAIAI